MVKDGRGDEDADLDFVFVLEGSCCCCFFLMVGLGNSGVDLFAFTFFTTFFLFTDGSGGGADGMGGGNGGNVGICESVSMERLVKDGESSVWHSLSSPSSSSI